MRTYVHACVRACVRACVMRCDVINIKVMFGAIG